MVSVCGFLTQYYFAVFAFFVAAAFILKQLVHGNLRKTLLFFLTEAVSAVCGIALFPASLKHLFEGDKGKETISLAQNAGKQLLFRCKEFTKLISLDFFGCEWGMAVLFCVVSMAFCACFFQKRSEINKRSSQWILLFFGTAENILFISVLATEVTNRLQFPNRYQFPIYPMLALCAVIVADILCVIRPVKYAFGALTAVFLFRTICLYNQGAVSFLYKGYETALEEVGEIAEGVYVTAGDHLVINDCLLLMQQEEIYVTEESGVGSLAKELEGKEIDRVTVYVNLYFDQQKVAEQAADSLGMESVELLYDNTYTKIYLLRSIR